jgi:hypothetical protein
MEDVNIFQFCLSQFLHRRTDCFNIPRLDPKLIVPFSKWMTKEGKGITLLKNGGQIGPHHLLNGLHCDYGNVVLIHSFTEKLTSVVPMSALWLVPQYFVAGPVEAFNAIGKIKILYS